jgi:hypothetical protein
MFGDFRCPGCDGQSVMFGNCINLGKVLFHSALVENSKSIRILTGLRLALSQLIVTMYLLRI